jgi:hypothetical protein
MCVVEVVVVPHTILYDENQMWYFQLYQATLSSLPFFVFLEESYFTMHGAHIDDYFLGVVCL